MHLEISSPTEAGGKRVKIKKKGWSRVLSARFQPIMSEERQKEDMEAEEAACNENPHVFMPRRDHAFEGMSHPTPQVTLRCNCDVKYLGRGIDQEDFEKLIDTQYRHSFCCATCCGGYDQRYDGCAILHG